jgi:hypothetical protein
MESTCRKNFFAHLLQLVAALSILGTSLALPAFADDLNYVVIVDPSGLSGTSGWMDVQFNPGALPGTQLAFADMEQPNAWLAGMGATMGSAFQSPLFGNVQFQNTTPFNDYFQPLVFGSSPDFFFLNFTGPALESPDGTSTSGSSFSLSFFDDNLNPVLTNNPDGFAAIININLDGTGTFDTFPNTDGGPSAVTVIDRNAPPPPTIPEPNTLLLLTTGLSGILTLTRRKSLSNAANERGWRH